MPEGELWEKDVSNGQSRTRLYSEMYLGNGGYAEELEPSMDSNSYADQFLGEERGLDEFPPEIGVRGETVSGRTKIPQGDKPGNTQKPRGAEKVLQNRIRDPEIVRKIYEIKNSFNPRDLPRLSKRSEKLLNANYRQLSIVESGLLSKKKAVKSVYVTSPFRGGGKTIAAVSMAYALSVYGGNDTLLVDGHFQSPQIHRLFSMRNTPGLNDALVNHVGALDVVTPTVYDHLFVVANGGRPNIQVSYEGEMIDNILRVYSAGFNYIIFDGAAVFASPEPAFFAPYFDGVVVTVECERTKWEVAQMTVEKILNSGGRVTGIILNKRKFYVPRMVYNKI